MKNLISKTLDHASVKKIRLTTYVTVKKIRRKLKVPIYDYSPISSKLKYVTI